MKHFWQARQWLLFVIVVSVASMMQAQTTTGSIYGAVVDSTGAAIPGAAVTAKETRTGIATTIKSNAAGQYIFQALNPGEYSVTSKAPGFKATTQNNIALSSTRMLISRSTW
jgi:protocatechuate 3,4-dioxygenase beta subunit